MMALHESTHAALSLSGQQPADQQIRELVAFGAEACLAAKLSVNTDGLKDYPAVSERMQGGYRPLSETTPISVACAFWARYLGTLSE
jgi:hypothetical protein